MKQITEEQGIDLMKEFQEKNHSGLGINENDIFSFKTQMKGKQYAYQCEASITEPSTEDANRIGKLLQILKSEIDSIGKKPCYFHVQILMSSDASLMMDEMNVMQCFLDIYDDIEIKWTLNTMNGASQTVKMQIIIVTE